MKKFLLPAMLLVGFLLSSSIETYACSCSPDIGNSPEKKVNNALSKADAVFSGEVLSLKTEFKRFVTVTIKVNTIWKGDLSEKIMINTRAGGGDCGFPFKKGKTYLIYAYGNANLNSLSTGYCSRTTVLDKDTEDLTILGKVKIPVKPES